ncbi:peptidoglycan DD-metalloendopeptidase family protein [Sphingomonas sp. TREG-RG-20F-R18-01]|uniref:murein hydrolase activator EnvC family protein n=1 Tax=Sphingomonas sp. TREG-RG-20F-R18-01 TaxID=2914982 RepID=UPI001F59DE5B|nr:peptidoglycan DD-metalloendopeptidase family protein [Sphingomonas sp. TREG-RG-20F-R18-01]
MRARARMVAVALSGIAVGSGAPAQQSIDHRALLARAKIESAAAAARSMALERRASSEQDLARQAQAREAAVVARIQQAEADIVAGQARVAIVDRLLEDQRGRLAEQQQPLARLLAALQSLARRPAIISVVQPGSIEDLVHVRAVLASTLPVIREKTQGIRDEVAQTRTLQAQATLAGQALSRSRFQLEEQRLALTRLEATHRARAQALGRDALFESDRAIALGETARDIVDSMDQADTQTATLQQLAALPGPVPRPLRPGATLSMGRGGWGGGAPYRLPVRGRVVIGFGELSDAGVRSRGLTLSTGEGADIVAPAAGRVAFAGPFRGYGVVIILDHGGGWTSLLAGLGQATVAVGARVDQGARIGTAASGPAARITVELRRRDRPVDMTPLLG